LQEHNPINERKNTLTWDVSLLADDDGSGLRNEPSSIAENVSSSSSLGSKMSTKGQSVRGGSDCCNK
jgi:hypothetical protein